MQCGGGTKNAIPADYKSAGYGYQDFQSDKMKTKTSFPRIGNKRRTSRRLDLLKSATLMPGGEEGDGDLEENPPFLFYDEKGMTIHQYLQGLKK